MLGNSSGRTSHCAVVDGKPGRQRLDTVAGGAVQYAVVECDSTVSLNENITIGRFTDDDARESGAVAALDRCRSRARC